MKGTRFGVNESFHRCFRRPAQHELFHESAWKYPARQVFLLFHGSLNENR
jgi:hypothetical protein